MFKFSTIIALIGGLTVASALSDAVISSNVDLLQASRPAILDQAALGDPGSYQAKAKVSTVETLKDVAGIQLFQVRQFYTLACIYHATNGLPNPRTNGIVDPAGPIPEWTITTNWVTTPNYCEWFGVSCFNTLSAPADQVTQEANKVVIEINLSENDLYGAFPNEIALIGNTLIAIDLFGNFFHHCIDYRWFSAMVTLEALFFGTTSWDADGIPVSLRFLTELKELDMSNTFWRGELTELAFNNLKKLRYLDMAQNFYDFTNLITLPDFVILLPLLTNVYIDNIRPSPGTSVANANLALTFLPRMNNIIELWMDYTNVNGPLPSNIGDATTLSSFSIVYCKITGTLPDSIINTALDRFWAYGNPNLTGALPPGFGDNLFFRFLFIEGTQITDITKAICDQRGIDETSSLTELGANCDICPANCCTCCGDGCNNLRTPTSAPTGSGPSFGICFSGNSIVEVENQGPVKMSNLALGDSVNVGANVFEPVYSFGHKNVQEIGDFLAIHAEGNRKIELSEDHMVNVQGGRIIPASMVKTGDMLVTASGDLAAVKSIHTVSRKGVFAPFTASGSIVVNDVVASNYVAFQGEEYLHVGGVQTPLTFEWIAHIFKSVHRIAYKMGLGSETYTEAGTSQWVAVPREIGIWLLEQNAVVTVGLLIPALAFFGFFAAAESLMSNPMAMATLVAGVLTLVAARRSVSVKMSKKM